MPNTHASIEAYYAVDLPSFSMPLHSHPQVEVMYAVKGSCEVHLQNTTYALAPHQYVILAPNAPHALQVTPGHPCTMLNLEFSLGSTGIPLQTPPKFTEPAAQYTDKAKVGYALKDLIGELEAPGTNTTNMQALLFHRLLAELARVRASDTMPGGAAYLNKATAYIKAHLFEELPVAAVATHAGVHPSYLQTLFRARFGCGVNSHIHNLRMEHARFLLSNTDLPLADIAAELGYNSRQHFGYVFTKRFSLSPNAYRALRGTAPEASTENRRERAEKGFEAKPF